MIIVQPTSAQSLIQDALEMLGVYAPGEEIESADAARAFSVLNSMVDELSAKSIYINQALAQVINLIANQATYTIGPVGASVTAPRPGMIQMGPAQASLSSPGRGENYVVNDTGTVVGGTGDATYRVTSVAPGGAVSGYVLTSPGTTYTTNAAAATATSAPQPGVGTGFLLSITASSGPITGSAFVGAVIGQPIDIISSIEYAAQAAYAAAASYPNSLNYKATFPLGTLAVIPAPSAVYNLFFQSWLRLVQFPDLFTQFSLAVGVYDGLRDNLAIALKTYWSDSQLDPIIPVRAGQALDFMRYQGIGSRAMMNRFMLTSNPQKKQ